MKIGKGTLGQAAAKSLSKAKFWASGHAPELLMAVGVVGFGATIYFTAKGAVKEESAKNEYHSMKAACNAAKEIELEPEQIDIVKKQEKDAVVEFAKETVKNFAPAVGCGIITLGCFTGGQLILKKRNVALVAAYKVVDEGFKNYRRNVIGELGEDADFRFKTSAHQETETVTEVDENGKKHKKKQKVDIIDTEPSGYMFIYDDRHSMASVTNAIIARDNLKMAEESANNLLHARGYITLNEVLRSIGLHETSAGQIVGWQMKGNGDGYVDFNAVQIRTALDDDGVAFMLDFNVDGPIYQDIDKYTRLWDEE